MDIKVSIDDFGVGYSSLTYMKKLPAPVIKIDQSFIRNMLEDPNDLALLQGVMGLANTFRRTVVAEGVENAEQGVLLCKLGCVYAAGIPESRGSMPAGEIIPWYSNWWPDVRWTQVAQVNRQDWRFPSSSCRLKYGRGEETPNATWPGQQSSSAGTRRTPLPGRHLARRREGGLRAGSPMLLQIERLASPRSRGWKQGCRSERRRLYQ